METHLERIEHQENLPLRIFVHSVRNCASHCHRDSEFLLVLRGQVMVQTSEGQVALKPDDVYFIPSGEMHFTHETTGTNLLVALQIDTAFATRLDPDFPRRRFAYNQIGRRFPNDRRLQATREIVAEILWEMRMRREGYRFQVESHLLRLLTLLVRDVPSTLAAPPKAEPQNIADDALGQRLARLVTYLEAHSNEEISSAELAASESVSVSYLARLFKTRLGCTVSEYVSIVRTKKSLPLLARRETTILDVAMECGFPNVKSYNTAFKRLFNLTPSQWRQQAGSDIPGIGESAYNRCDAGFAFHLLRKYLPAGSAYA
ncbi:MAG: helix-turn-helix domain-containing protein [Candidatus Didemnitutus sp.]|nr:helix-turn-helix domain-containing protein [Candidatus Didemnitutus sp.]